MIKTRFPTSIFVFCHICCLLWNVNDDCIRFFTFANEADGGHHCVWERGQTAEFENCPEQRISAKFPSGGAKCWKNLAAAAKMFQSWQSAPPRQPGQVSGGRKVCAALSYTFLHTNTTLQARVQQEDFTGASTGSEVAETGE